MVSRMDKKPSSDTTLRISSVIREGEKLRYPAATLKTLTSVAGWKRRKERYNRVRKFGRDFEMPGYPRRNGYILHGEGGGIIPRKFIE